MNALPPAGFPALLFGPILLLWLLGAPLLFRIPRGPLWQEVCVASGLALGPALVLGLIGLQWFGDRAPPEFLLVDPGAAIGVSALGVAFVSALAWRLTRARPEDVDALDDEPHAP